MYSVKRIIGQAFSNPQLQRIVAELPYEVFAGENQEPMVRTRGGEYTVPKMSAHVVDLAKKIACAHTGKEVGHCVVTVPANFNDAQREATRRAVRAGGLEVLRILNEPTAAALAYGHGQVLNERIAVFDMGGGTFDLSVLAVRRGLYEVLATGGDSFLGGDDMDRCLADALALRFLEQYRIDPRADFESQSKLRVAAEEIKIALSTQTETTVKIDGLGLGLDGQSLNFETVFSRTEFEELIQPFVERALQCAQQVLADADMLPQNVDQVLLVGGATNVPLVRRRVADLFGRAPQGGIDPMKVVALGAAAHAQSLFAPETISRGSTTEDGEELELMPMDLLMDVTSHSVGLATAGGFAEVLLPKNSPIPAEASRFFSTARDNQECVVLKVCQGDEPRFENNEAIGELRIEGLRPAPRGQVKIEVGFLVDADGVLQVSGRDQDTGTETTARLSLFGLSDDDLIELD